MFTPAPSAAFYGVMFVGNEEPAFANYRLWESLGFVFIYLIDTNMVMRVSHLVKEYVTLYPTLKISFQLLLISVLHLIFFPQVSNFQCISSTPTLLAFRRSSLYTQFKYSFGSPQYI